MKSGHLRTGSLGESIAKKHLKRKGYEILKQNYKNKYAEIDLIARDKDSLVFVEVRTRVGEKFGTPEESINRNKLNKLVKNAEAYINFRNYKGKYRIDAVCIVLYENKKPRRVSHYKSITL